MKYILLLTMLLTGCATTKPVIPLNIQAPSEIMKDCEELEKPKDFTFGAFVVANLEYKKLYEQCKNQNKAKKDFIININK